MASITSICGICSLRQITTTSEHWCPQCEEALCNECKEHHKLLKATRSHEPIPISNYKSLPLFITELQQSCAYHNETFQQYCVEHSLPICFKCITDHQKCTVVPFEEITNNAKTSAQFQDLETRLVDLLQNIDQMKKDRKGNLASIGEMKKKHLADIEKIRVDINKHLDNLERQIIKDLEEKECQCKEDIQRDLSSVKEKETTIKQCQANYQCIKQYASDLQIFLGMREIEIQINENEEYLQSLMEAKVFEQLDLVYEVDTGVQSILNKLKNFGSTKIKARPSKIAFSRAKDKQAQFQIAAVSKTINDMKVILQKKITTDGNAVRGCCTSGELFLFSDHYHKQSLNVCKSDGTISFKMSVYPCSGFALTLCDDQIVAITSGDSQKTGIDIINIENRSKIKFIKLPGRSYGITRDQDTLFVCVEGRGIYIVDILDNTNYEVISCNLPQYSYVSVIADKIYYTDKNDNSVVCCDRKGSRIWDFKDDSVLKCPRGITVDNEGHLFVVGAVSSNVVIISNDGKHHKEILTKEDGLCEPSAVCFDKQTRQFLVANAKQIAFLYRVT